MKVLISCGGTGGHILPALRLYEELVSSKKVKDVVILVDQRCVENKILYKDYKVIMIPASSIRLDSLKKFFISCFVLVKSALSSFKILLIFKPDIVIGFGGYASFFPVLMGFILGSKTIIHEENVLMGRANRLLAFFVDKISLGFEETKQIFPLFKNKMVFTGNPLRKNIKRLDKKEALRYFDFSSDCFTILVMGGSQGSTHINREFLKTAIFLQDKVRLQVIHLSGDRDFDFLNKEYNSVDVKVALFGFLESMEYALSGADLVLCRAGAMTISELIFFQLPAVIVPYPYAYKHQLYNARILADAGCAILLEDKCLNYHSLSQIILDLVKNHHKLESMRYNYYRFKNLKTITLWDVVLSFN